MSEVISEKEDGLPYNEGQSVHVSLFYHREVFTV